MISNVHTLSIFISEFLKVCILKVCLKFQSRTLMKSRKKVELLIQFRRNEQLRPASISRYRLSLRRSPGKRFLYLQNFISETLCCSCSSISLPSDCSRMEIDFDANLTHAVHAVCGSGSRLKFGGVGVVTNKHLIFSSEDVLKILIILWLHSKLKDIFSSVSKETLTNNKKNQTVSLISVV